MALQNTESIYQPPARDLNKHTNPIDAFNVSVVGSKISWRRFYLATGRVFLAFIFVVSGIMKLFSWNETSAYMNIKGLPAVPLLLLIAATIEIVCGLLVAFGRQVRVSAILLAFYLIIVTFVFHNFWEFSGLQAQDQMVHFLKNFSIIGGLLCLYTCGTKRRDERGI